MPPPVSPNFNALLPPPDVRIDMPDEPSTDTSSDTGTGTNSVVSTRSASSSLLSLPSLRSLHVPDVGMTAASTFTGAVGGAVVNHIVQWYGDLPQDPLSQRALVLEILGAAFCGILYCALQSPYGNRGRAPTEQTLQAPASPQDSDAEDSRAGTPV